MIAARFPDTDSLISMLSDQLLQGRLALFLGAGISRDLEPKDDGTWMGLPGWKSLIENMYDAKGVSLSEPDLLKAAQTFRLNHCSTNDEYVDAVQKALYKGISLDFASLRRNDTLGAIGALVMASQRGQVGSVFTFNFDDVLERYLGYHGFLAKPIFGPRFWDSNADTVIYHPHGFLPSPESPFLERSEDVILDAKSYAEKTGNAADRFNQKIATVMQANTCLFVGISGDDIRMVSLMLESKGKHAYNPDSDGYWGVAFSLSEADTAAWRERGIYLQKLTDYQTGLPSFLLNICQRAAAKRKAFTD